MRKFLIAAALLVSSAANAQQTLPPVNVNATRLIEHNDVFGQKWQTVVSASGVEYFAPGSSMEKGADSFMRSGIYGAKTSAKRCDDGKPVRYEYNFPGGPSCAADRPL